MPTAGTSYNFIGTAGPFFQPDPAEEALREGIDAVDSLPLVTAFHVNWRKKAFLAPIINLTIAYNGELGVK